MDSPWGLGFPQHGGLWAPETSVPANEVETASLLTIQPLLPFCRLKKRVVTHSNSREGDKDPKCPWGECLQQYLIKPHKTLGQKEGDGDQEAPRGKLPSLWLGAEVGRTLRC